MSTIITQTSGGRTRRCDAKCYNAKGRKCRCICGGLNHGVGLNQAAINASKLVGYDSGIVVNQVQLELIEKKGER